MMHLGQAQVLESLLGVMLLEVKKTQCLDA
jgi:hypothetical protein